MTTPTSAATLAAWPGRHRNAIGTLMVLALLALVIFGEQIGETPDEAVARSVRYCTWGIRTGVERDARCDEMAQRLEQDGARQPPDVQVAGWMQLAEYRLLRGDPAAARAGCVAAMKLYETLPVDGKTRPQREWDLGLCQSLAKKFPD